MLLGQAVKMNLFEVSQVPVLLLTNQVKIFVCQPSLLQHPLQAGCYWHQISWGILQHSCQHPSSGCSVYASHYFACPVRFPLAGWGSIKTWYAHSKCPFRVLLHVLFTHRLPPGRRRLSTHGRMQFLPYMTQLGTLNILDTCTYFWLAETFHPWKS